MAAAPEQGSPRHADPGVIAPPGTIVKSFEAAAPETPEDAAHRRRMEWLTWWAGTVLAVGVSFGALLVGALTIFYGATDDVRKLGVGLIVPVVTAVLGYIAGRGVRK